MINSEKVRDYIKSKMAGVQERINTADRLDIEIAKAPKVLCILCGEIIYYLKVGSGSYKFARTERFEVRDDLICPACGGVFVGYHEDQPIIKTDRGWV